MTDTIDIFNDVIKILDSIVEMESSIGKSVLSAKQFTEDFKAGNLEKAKADCDALSSSLGGAEKVFKEKTLEPAMDLYQKIKKLMHIHIGEAEKQLSYVEEHMGLKQAKAILEKLK